MSDTLLQIEGVYYAYGGSDWQLRNVCLSIHPGEVIGIIGPNGAGKSTLLKIAAGTLRPREGMVVLLGGQIGRLSRRMIARHLGYLPQNVTGAFDYHVEEVVAMGRFPHLAGAGFLQRRDIEVVERCLENTEMTAYRNRPLSQLSGGERQRVLLASVLAQEPRVLLLDEPTTGLDLHHQATFFKLLFGLAARRMGVAVVTHDLNLASLFCDRLLLLQEGRVIKEGTVSEVVRQDILSDVYRGSVYVGRHPVLAKPIALPLAEQQGIVDKGLRL